MLYTFLFVKKYCCCIIQDAENQIIIFLSIQCIAPHCVWSIAYLIFPAPVWMHTCTIVLALWEGLSCIKSVLKRFLIFFESKSNSWGWHGARNGKDVGFNSVTLDGVDVSDTHDEAWFMILWSMNLMTRSMPDLAGDISDEQPLLSELLVYLLLAWANPVYFSTSYQIAELVIILLINTAYKLCQRSCPCFDWKDGMVLTPLHNFHSTAKRFYYFD